RLEDGGFDVTFTRRYSLLTTKMYDDPRGNAMMATAKNMLQSALRPPAAGPVAGQACPRLLGAGRFIMAVEKGSQVSRTNLPPPQLRRINTLAWVLECFTKGQMEVGIEQSPLQRVEPGWSMLYSPGTRYHERVEPGQRCHSIVI